MRLVVGALRLVPLSRRSDLMTSMDWLESPAVKPLQG